MTAPMLHLSFCSHWLPCDFAIPHTQKMASISSSSGFGFALWSLLWSAEWGRKWWPSNSQAVSQSFTLLLALRPPSSILEYVIHTEQSWVLPVVPAKVSLEQSIETTSRFLRSSQVPSPPFQKYKQYMFALDPWWDFLASLLLNILM